MACGDMLRPICASQAMICWATTSEIPMVTNGNTMVIGFRYTRSRIVNTMSAVAISIT